MTRGLGGPLLRVATTRAMTERERDWLSLITILDDHTLRYVRWLATRRRVRLPLRSSSDHRVVAVSRSLRQVWRFEPLRAGTDDDVIHYRIADVTSTADQWHLTQRARALRRDGRTLALMRYDVAPDDWRYAFPLVDTNVAHVDDVELERARAALAERGRCAWSAATLMPSSYVPLFAARDATVSAATNFDEDEGRIARRRVVPVRLYDFGDVLTLYGIWTVRRLDRDREDEARESSDDDSSNPSDVDDAYPNERERAAWRAARRATCRDAYLAANNDREDSGGGGGGDDDSSVRDRRTDSNVNASSRDTPLDVVLELIMDEPSDVRPSRSTEAAFAHRFFELCRRYELAWTCAPYTRARLALVTAGAIERAISSSAPLVRAFDVCKNRSIGCRA